MELESELRELAAEIEWPRTPALRSELEPRRGLALRCRVVVAAVAVAVVSVAAAFAVPQSRGAILRFLGLGAVRVELVERLPAAQERPLAEGLGSPISPAIARGLLGRSPLLPPLTPSPPLHAHGGIVSLLFREGGEPVLLSELGSHAPVLKKIALTSRRVRWVEVGNDPAIWIGAGHVVAFPQAPPRLAGGVLLWRHGGLTLRLEGAHLGLPDALRLAQTIG